MTDHHLFMREAIKESQAAVARGNQPYGAVLVHQGNIIARGQNSEVTDRDITGHAELNLVREAFRRFPAETLAHSTLYASTEPCAMCAGSIYWAGIGAVVYGCGTRAAGQLTGEAFTIPCAEIFARGGRQIVVTGPLLQDEALAVVRPYWEQHRR
ncbi:MAG: nucleoside deaminase [Gammaproteobacteria bacterium]